MKNQFPQGSTIKDVFEIIENQQDQVEILRNRIKCMKSYSTLGPPDLCYLSKKYQSGSILPISKEQVQIGTYHYVHGINLSTPASVSAYINLMIKNMEEEKQTLLKRGEWKIVKGYFCIFDSFSRIDIHIEITIPGTMKLYGFKIDGELVTITDQLWERAMVSSGLRSMHQQDVPAGKYLQEFQTMDQLHEFLKAFSNVVKEIDLPYENQEEVEKYFEYRGSKSLYLLVEYLTRKRMYQIALNFLIENVSENPKMILHLNQLYIQMKQYPDGLKLIANYLIQQPDSPLLLYQQARNLFSCGKYEDSYRLANFLVGIHSTSFDVWFLLAEIFYKMENFEYCFVTLNQASKFAKVSLRQGFFPDKQSTNSMQCEKNKSNKQLTQPKEWGTISSFNNIYVINNNIPLLLRQKANQNDKQKTTPQSLEQIDSLTKLLSSEFCEDEFKIYQLLIEMEKKIGWENMIKLRTNIFMINQDGFSQIYDRSNDFPFNILHQNQGSPNQQASNPMQQGAGPQGSKSHPSQDSQNSHKASNKFEDQVATANSQGSNRQASIQPSQVIQQFPPEYDGTDFSDDEEQLPQFLKDDNEDSKQKNYGMANIKDPQIQKNIQRKLHLINQKQLKAQNNPKFEKNSHITELTEDSAESERVQNLNISNKLLSSNVSNSANIPIAFGKQRKKVPAQINPSINDLLPYPQKRPIHKTFNGVFQSLYEDLNYLIKWQNEDKIREELLSQYERIKYKKQHNTDFSNLEQQKSQLDFTADVWLLRSQLAMRLKFYPLAQKGLREVLKKNFCFNCFDNLIKIAEANDEPKTMIYVITELLDEIENFGVKQINQLPSWIEDHLLQLIAKKSLRQFKAYLNELKFEDPIINEVIKRANYFSIEGTSDLQQIQQKQTPLMNALDAFNNNQQRSLNQINKTTSLYQ
ncbi:hypothetical protein ABPG72_016681 [Tetrahymena utriculariae]